MIRTLSLAVCCALFLPASCKKEEKATGCFADAATIRTITDKRAVVRLTGTADGVHLVEEGTIDTILLPCELPPEFYQDGLPVIISGEVKATPPVAGRPCCFENIVLTKIAR